MARYGRIYKRRVVARLLPPESAAVDVVSREVGVSVTTLERWRAEALAAPAGELPWSANCESTFLSPDQRVHGWSSEGRQSRRHRCS